MDSNTILVEGMQDSTSGEMMTTYQALVDLLREKEFEQKLHILNNKREIYREN